VAVTLRRFGPADLDYLQTWRRNIDSDRYMASLKPLRFSESGFGGWGRSYVWFVIVAGGTDVGAVWIDRRRNHPGQGVLGIVIGHTERLGRGIGRQAIMQALFRARGILGFDSVRLTVRQSNNRAVHCYRRCGFRVTGSGIKPMEDGDKVPFYRMERRMLDIPGGASRVVGIGSHPVFTSCAGGCPCAGRLCLRSGSVPDVN